MHIGKRDWIRVGAWSIPAAILTFAIIGMMSIGMFVLPFAWVAAFLVARRNRWWPEGPAGVLIGAAAVALYVGVTHLDEGPPCPEHVRVVIHGQGHFRCGGLDPTPWFAVGAVLAAIGVLGYVLIRMAVHRRERSALFL